MKKYCAYHKTYHDVSEFGKDRSRPGGLHQYCKKARSEMGKKIYNENLKTLVPTRMTSRKKRDLVHYSNYFSASLVDEYRKWNNL